MSITGGIIKMRRLIAMVVFASALSLYVCAMADTTIPKSEAAKPLIKCSTCGVEFTSQAGIQDHLKAHPDHMAAPVTEAVKPLIKCATCGALFTSQAGIED